LARSRTAGRQPNSSRQPLFPHCPAPLRSLFPFNTRPNPTLAQPSLLAHLPLAPFPLSLSPSHPHHGPTRLHLPLPLSAPVPRPRLQHTGALRSSPPSTEPRTQCVPAHSPTTSPPPPETSPLSSTTY
jgi:hypothetical protein